MPADRTLRKVLPPKTFHDTDQPNSDRGDSRTLVWLGSVGLHGALLLGLACWTFRQASREPLDLWIEPQTGEETELPPLEISNLSLAEPPAEVMLPSRCRPRLRFLGRRCLSFPTCCCRPKRRPRLHLRGRRRQLQHEQTDVARHGRGGRRRRRSIAAWSDGAILWCARCGAAHCPIWSITPTACTRDASKRPCTSCTTASKRCKKTSCFTSCSTVMRSTGCSIPTRSPNWCLPQARQQNSLRGMAHNRRNVHRGQLLALFSVPAA